jgi:hypothetical protein
MKAHALFGTAALALLSVGCGSTDAEEIAPSGAPQSTGGSAGSAGVAGTVAKAGGGGASADSGDRDSTVVGTGGSADSGTPPLGTSVHVQLVPADGVTGLQRVNFAVPVQAGQVTDAARVRVLRGADEVAAARRGLSSYRDGSVRSVQIQLDIDIAGTTDLEVRLNEQPTTSALSLVSVDTTLVVANGEQGPRVWAVLPAAWLSASGFAGPLVPEADVASLPTAAWAKLCDCGKYDLAAFLASGYQTDRAVWLFDRGTALYRGYARRGEIGPLRSAYAETSMYRNGITGVGTAARNGIPGGAADDVKYAYAQNLALHYLLTGDDRYRDSAEDMALGMSQLWPDPGYAGGADFWTERHAGFALLAYVWAMIVSDDQGAAFRKLADTAVDAYLDMQQTYPVDYTDADARCFAHTADAHGEGGAYFGCSPWMSAILADGLEQYATESDAARADAVRTSLVKLGRIIAKRGIQPDGRPYYFMNVSGTGEMLDDFNEHFGESAYIMGMAWYFAGKTDASLRTAADALVTRLGTDGEAPHIRSFNWQCRSAIAGPWFLR